MRYLSVCSGIEAASVAWKDLGWECVGVSEIEKFPSAVLAHHYPSVPNFGDLNFYREWPDDLAPDLIVGGTPCQSFSVAGLRAGLADPRGNLALVFLGLVDKYRPRYVVWENVPGVRSSGGGRDFGAFLGALGELGYGWAYRSLDAQYFGLAQRRERVFVVGCLGDWRASAAVLLESEGLRGDPAPRRETREGAARDAGTGAGGRGTWPEVAMPVMARDAKGPRNFYDGGLQASVVTPVAYAADVAPAIPASGAGSPRTGNERTEADFMVAIDKRTAAVTDGISPTLKTDLARDMGPVICADIAKTLTSGGNGERGHLDPVNTELVVAFDTTQITSPKNYSNPQAGDTDHPLAAQAHVPAIISPALTASNDPSRSPQSSEITQQVAAVHAASMAVRRLTPRECERLQGFPDDYTLIPYRNGMSADGPRYKALGNSMAVPVMAFIGRRIADVRDALA